VTDWKTRIANAAGVALVCLTLPAAAASIDVSRSSLTATFRQMNVPVEGSFKRISGDVVFDVARPQDARAALDIDLASFPVRAEPQRPVASRACAFGDSEC